jgi:hypothetical protein
MRQDAGQHIEALDWVSPHGLGGVYELGYEHKGFQEIAFEVSIQSKQSKEKICEFIRWADRSPPHATLRRAVRLIRIFYPNDQHIATAIYHADRTEWRQ